MNAQLRLKLIQCRSVRALSPAPAKHDPALPRLRLLGEGLDAIVQHTARPGWGWLRHLMPDSYDPTLPSKPDAQQRLHRYHVAELLHPLHKDPVLADQRAVLGGVFHAYWRAGKFPKVRATRGLIGLPRIRAC